MHPPYAVHPSVRWMVHWVLSLEEKTGRSLEEWVRHVKKEGPGGGRGAARLAEEGARPRHVRLARSLGKDVRIDFGLALKDTKAKGRLIDTGGFRKKDRITHRIPITSADEIDAEVERWLRKAYAMDA